MSFLNVLLTVMGFLLFAAAAVLPTAIFLTLGTVYALHRGLREPEPIFKWAAILVAALLFAYGAAWLIMPRLLFDWIFDPIIAGGARLATQLAWWLVSLVAKIDFAALTLIGWQMPVVELDLARFSARCGFIFAVIWLFVSRRLKSDDFRRKYQNDLQRLDWCGRALVFLYCGWYMRWSGRWTTFSEPVTNWVHKGRNKEQEVFEPEFVDQDVDARFEQHPFSPLTYLPMDHQVLPPPTWWEQKLFIARMRWRDLQWRFRRGRMKDDI
jgi:hypothetical protein